MTKKLDSKVAIVTGSGRGIGREIARKLAAEGASVVVNDLDEGPAKQTVADIEADGGKAVLCAGSVADAGFAQHFVNTAAQAFGGLDIIVNNAGYNLNARFAEMTDDSWERMLAIHASAPFRLLRAAAPHLAAAAERDRVSGREVFRKVVNVSSIAVMGSAFQANYAAGKAAVVGLTKSLAKEWGPLRINVNAVAFGSVDTRLTRPRTTDNVLQADGEKVQLGLSPRVVGEAAATIPFGRLATAREAAGGVFLLCTPWSDWINGQLIVVSGGQTFGMSA
jgi:3-oxoacyl-[acyl-carrier protein] reductase